MAATLPPDVKRALDAALNGERILWSAQPDGKRRGLAFAMWLFAIPWTVFALFWEAMALTILFGGGETGMPGAMRWGFGIVFPLFGLPFIAVGFWMLWQPVAKVREAARTVYALTDRRLFELVIGRTTAVKSVPVDRIGPIERRSSKDGWGSLSIQTHSRIDSDGDRVTEKFEVLGIPDVAALERRILDMQTR